MFGQVKFSQDFNVSTGAPYKVVDAHDKEYFPDGKGNSISVKTQELKVTIQRYDVQSMKEINRNEYKDLPKDSKVEKIIKVGDRLFYFHSAPNKGTRFLYVREININDGTFKPAKLLLESKGEVVDMNAIISIGIPLGKPISKYFEVIESFDHSKILVKYRRKPLNKNDDVNYDLIGFYSFNVNLDKLWGGEVKMPYTEKAMNNLAYTIGKDGTAYMLAFITAGKQFELFVIKNETSLKTNKLNVDGTLFFQELKMAENVDGNLVCTGYYANGIDFKVNWTGNMSLSMNTNGILRFKMSPTGTIIEKYKYDFPITLINQYESNRAKEKNADREADGKAGIGDLKMIKVQENADGSALMVGEQIYHRTEFVGTSTKTVYYHGDIIVTKIDKIGKLLWMIKLPKTQISLMSKGGNGIKYIQGDGYGYVLFLDNKKNVDITKDAVPVKYEDGRPGYLNAYKIEDATGSYSKHLILDIDNVNGIEAYQFATSRIFDVTSTIFLIEIYMKGKEDTMIKIQLKK
jgi:hypothetical protein